MKKRSLSKTFIQACTSSTVSAIINMITTILIARWLGDHIYANYIIDLAFVSIILIILEIIPSNYVVFKVQDDSNWINCAAVQAIASAVIITIITAIIGEFFSLFKQHTHWISSYTALMVVKRFLDISQQSKGNIAEFIKLEAYVAALRLIIFLFCAQTKIPPTTTVWMSLVLANAIVQLSWFIAHPEDRKPFKNCMASTSVRPIMAERKNYPGYYCGIALKRIRDNIVPLVADRFFTHKSELATFFIAYRGVLFARSQIRILEGILNYRPATEAVNNLSPNKIIMIAGLAQIGAMIASSLILLISNSNQIDFLTNFFLSLIIWPSTYMKLKRAKAYSNYQTKPINFSLTIYSLTLTIICYGLMILEPRNNTAFSLALVSAESLGLLALNSKKITGKLISK